MEHNEITMDMDVKMDLKEKKLEYFQLRTWTKCTVKIEAIKYIPCFVKITLIQSSNDEKSNVVIKINIPGVGVQLANSRSKAYSYGLFWTQHRKNCCIFFALDSKSNLERHINWIQNSITNLEIHRREVLESRRASRISRMEENSVLRSLNTSVDGDARRCNDTQDIRDINVILGPLPKLPDANWSRRFSSTSEIYEEIGDGNRYSCINRKSSRTSVASGIYEVMTSPFISTEQTAQMLEEMAPPPLPPPRPRVNTQTEMNRAYTNPEAISKKTKRNGLFGTVFSRHKSMQKRKSPKPKPLTTTKAGSPIIELIRSHRMSYSSPDLSKVDVGHYVQDFESDLMARSSAEFSIRNEHSFLNSTTAEGIFDDERNISANILSNFNISCNDSTVNLVGSNLNENAIVEKKPVATIIDDVSGYCRMAPIIRSGSASTSPVSAPVLQSKSSPFVVVDNSSQVPTVDVTKTITFCRDYGMEASLQNFENFTISKENSQNATKDTKVNSSSRNDPADDEIKLRKSSLQPCKHQTNSLDEKYPSYYPNDVQKTPIKDYRNSDNGIKYLAKNPNTPERTENVYIATPRHGSTRSAKTPVKPSNLAILSPTDSVVSSSASQLLTPTLKSTMSESIQSASPLLYHKYATVTPTNDSASCRKSHDITTGSMKRFYTLPRFKRIDFSPLKLKINSVLQRHNPDQM